MSDTDILREVTSDWHVPTSFMSCLPTCMANIFHDAKKHRYNVDNINYSFKEVCKIIKWERRRGAGWYEARDEMKKELNKDNLKPDFDSSSAECFGNLTI